MGKLTKLLVFTALILPLSLGACTPKLTKWGNPGVSADQQSYDIAECRSRARKKVEQNSANRSLDEISSFNTSSSFENSMQSYEGQKKKSVFFQSCLKRKGYHPIVPGSSL